VAKILAVIEHHHRRTWVRGVILQGSWLLVAASLVAHRYGWLGVAILCGGILMVFAVLLLTGCTSLSL
jgi:hypothetical protein